MLIRPYLRYLGRLCFRNVCPAICFLVCFYLTLIYRGKPSEISSDISTKVMPDISTKIITQCDFKPAIDEFILNYKPNGLLGTKPNIKRVEPTVERIRNLLEIIRLKEAKYQSLLQNFNVFDMLKPMVSLQPYSDESNIDEIKSLYHRYIKLMPDKKSIEIDPKFLDYLRTTSSYLSDGLRKNRMKQFEVQCLRKPVFVLACDSKFFDGSQGAIRTLDTYWPNHQIIFYDMGLKDEQKQLLKSKCKQCTIIDFPFSLIEKYAPHIRRLSAYTFKPFVVQDALRRYGTIIYGDASARFNENSFDPVLIDNYIRGFAARELPGHTLSCFTRSGTFTWFNQSYTQFEAIYMAEANFLVVTDTLISRLIMKAWLTCVLETDCLISADTREKCDDGSRIKHRFDQSAMGIILTYFFFQGDQSSWSNGKVNDPAPYDMFTSVQANLGDIKRVAPEHDYLANKKIV